MPSLGGDAEGARCGTHAFPGVSNVSLGHLEQMTAVQAEGPEFVQNRCYARLGWDREVREFCREHKINYAGAGCICVCARVGMLPLTGTTYADHMRQDLASGGVKLSAEEIRAIETLAG